MMEAGHIHVHVQVLNVCSYVFRSICREASVSVYMLSHGSAQVKKLDLYTCSLHSAWVSPLLSQT